MIKIISGTYGYCDKNGHVVPKTPEDGPFSIEKEKEARLVKRGIAEYVKESKPKADEKPAKEVKVKRQDLIKKYKELNLPGNPASMKNDDLIEAISNAESDDKSDAEGEDEEDGSDEDTPDFSDVDGVDG